MARTRTTPEALATVTEDRLSQFVLFVEYNADGSLNTGSTRFAYKTAHHDATGALVDTDQREISFANWPANLKTDIKALYDRCMSHAESEGIVGAGTDTDDLA